MGRFFAQAGDLEDAWGPAIGPCFSGTTSQWGCCDPVGVHMSYQANRSSATCRAGTNGKPEICDPACAAAAGTATKGGIHPRSKLPVGERLATAAFNVVYGGTGANTGRPPFPEPHLTCLYPTDGFMGQKILLWAKITHKSW